jgi:Putative phage abortive infection protein
MLFYNCLSEYGREKFKPMIEEFSLLDNMSPRTIIHKNHIKYYARSAFPELMGKKN